MGGRVTGGYRRSPYSRYYLQVHTLTLIHILLYSTIKAKYTITYYCFFKEYSFLISYILLRKDKNNYKSVVPAYSCEKKAWECAYVISYYFSNRKKQILSISRWIHFFFLVKRKNASKLLCSDWLNWAHIFARIAIVQIGFKLEPDGQWQYCFV